MPKKAEISQRKSSTETINNDLSDDCPVTPEVGCIAIPALGKKRSKDEVLEFDGDTFNCEMQKMLSGLGADISKTLMTKRKKLEELTQHSRKTSNKKIDEVMRSQQLQRSKLIEEYQKQAVIVFTQWEADLENTKQQEDKLNALFRQQQKIFQQSRASQNQRLSQLRQIHEQFNKGIEELTKTQESQAQSSVQSELKKEMALLTKRILMGNQHSEMANVRKSFQSSFF